MNENQRQSKRTIKESTASGEVDRMEFNGSTDRRSSARVDSDFNAACIMQTVSYNVELLDLGRLGARIRIRQGLLPVCDSKVSLCFMDGKALDAIVIWTKKTDCGLKFNEPMSDFDEQTNFDDLGADFFRSVLKFQISK
jgi:hypothetical protein